MWVPAAGPACPPSRLSPARQPARGCGSPRVRGVADPGRTGVRRGRRGPRRPASGGARRPGLSLRSRRGPAGRLHLVAGGLRDRGSRRRCVAHGPGGASGRRWLASSGPRVAVHDVALAARAPRRGRRLLSPRGVGQCQHVAQPGPRPGRLLGRVTHPYDRGYAAGRSTRHTPSCAGAGYSGTQP